jgi:pimeloyl-ACP methyl ester carboxylesterase
MHREERAFTVRDGRVVWAQLIGPEDGTPVFIHMGTPGSRSIWEGYVKAGAERGLRHICCSRPGYEGSDRQPGRTVADVAADIGDVADKLDYDRFFVTGVSFGANHALACAALLPHRVLAALSMAAIAPRDAAGLDWLAGMGKGNLAEFKALAAGPSTLEAFIEEEVPQLGTVPSEAEFVDDLKDWVEPIDIEAFRSHLFEAARVEYERLARGGIWGWYDDDWALWKDWGLDPSGIGVPVSLWHGGKDLLVPLSHGEWLVAEIPFVREHFLEDMGHMSLWAHHYGAALDELLELGGR